MLFKRDINAGTPFFAGILAGFSFPLLMIFMAMLGFGSLAKSQGISLMVTFLSATGIYGLPGQIVMLELYATGATLVVILIGVAMANMRFLPMSIVLMPLFDKQDAFFKWRYLIVQFMSINSWSHMSHVADKMPKERRMGFFTGFALMCFSGGAVGAALGWVLAANMPLAVTLTLIFLNPAYFIFLFCTSRRRDIILSIVLGALSGPVFYMLSPGWGLPVCGLVAGTLGFFLVRKLNVQH